MNAVRIALLSIMFAGLVMTATPGRVLADGPVVVRYGYETVGGVKVFYREAGNPENPTLVLLHGFPTSSHQYRDLMTMLGSQYHLVAPDYPGFGSSDYPAADKYEYSFDNIAKTVDQFLEQRGLTSYSLMIQDYGAPVGFRIATGHPERVQSLIIQNGNAYEEGLNKETWAPIMSYWEGKTAEKEKLIIENVFSFAAMKWQYTHGTRNPESILPDNWLLDFASLSRPGQHAVQLGLFYDYQNNVKLYPQWQAYLKKTPASGADCLGKK